MCYGVDLEMRGQAKTTWFCPFCQVPHPGHPRGAVRCLSCSAVVELADMTVLVRGGGAKAHRAKNRPLQSAPSIVERVEEPRRLPVTKALGDRVDDLAEAA